MEQKKSILDLKKSWQWMAYIYFALPLIMFVLGWLMGDNDMGKFFSGLFHAYNLYIMNPLLENGDCWNFDPIVAFWMGNQTKRLY